ncbi:hypothetical protein JCM33374_g1338 [Metschnikowia sp. JCM 33374]|nr:hypothetical protein JCM33374_g1338 [Metschnikowia sp. JCM 33374]
MESSALSVKDTRERPKESSKRNKTSKTISSDFFSSRLSSKVSSKFSLRASSNGTFSREINTKTATKTTTTTTTNGEELEGKAPVLTRISGLFKFNSGVKEKKTEFSNTQDLGTSPQIEGQKVSRTFPVSHIVGTEEVVINTEGYGKTEEHKGKVPTTSEDFFPKPQPSKLDSDGTKGREYPERKACHDTVLQYASLFECASLEQKKSSNNKWPSKRLSIHKRYFRKGCLKLARGYNTNWEELQTNENIPCKQAAGGEGDENANTGVIDTLSDQNPRSKQKNIPEYELIQDCNGEVKRGEDISCGDIKNANSAELDVTPVTRNHSSWSMPFLFEARPFMSTQNSASAPKNPSDYGCWRFLLRKLHMASFTRKVNGWSRKGRVAAKYTSSAGNIFTGHRNLYDSESEQNHSAGVYCGEATSSLSNSRCGRSAGSILESVVARGEQIGEPEFSVYINTEKLDTNGDTYGAESFDIINGLINDWEESQVFGGKVKPEYSDENDGLHGVDKTSTSTVGDNMEIEHSETREIAEQDKVAKKGFMGMVSKCCRQYCSGSLRLAESVSTHEREPSRVSDNQRQEPLSRPNSGNLNGISVLGVKGKIMSSESPQNTGEKSFKAQILSSAISKDTQGRFMKGLNILGSIFGHVEAEMSETFTLTAEIVQDVEKHILDEDKAEVFEPADGVSEDSEASAIDEPFLEISDCGCSARQSGEFIEKKIETEEEDITDSEFKQESSSHGEEMDEIEYHRLVIALGSVPAERNDTLWYFLKLTEREGWQRIRDDFLGGEDLYIACEAKKSLFYLPKMKSIILEKANFGGNDDCGTDLPIMKKISFSQELEVTTNKAVPCRGILKKPKHYPNVPTSRGTISNIGAFQEFKQPLTEVERQHMEKEMLRRLDDCREALCKFTGKQKLAHLKEPLHHFTSCFSFTLVNYVRVAKKQFLDYNHYLSEIRSTIVTALVLLRGAGEQFSLLVDFINTTSKSEQSLLEVHERASLLMCSFASSESVLQKAQKALIQLRGEDFDYAKTMIGLLETAMLSKRNISDTYKLFHVLYIQDNVDKTEADIITKFGDFEKEVESLEKHTSCYGISKLDKTLESFQKACDIINKARGDIETRTMQIITGVAELRSGGSTLGLVSEMES